MNSELKVWTKGEKAWSWYFLSTYPITMTLGFILAFFTVAYFWKKQKYPWEYLQILLIIIVPSSLVGARLWYMLFPPAGVTVDWSQFFRFEGLAIQGGVMASATAASIFLFYVRHKIDYRTAFGIILPAVIIGQAMGRWGNFHNHEVYGAAIGDYITGKGSGMVSFTPEEIERLNGSSLNWLTFIKSHMLISDKNGVAYRQPFFFYEFILNFLGYLIGVWWLLRKNYFKPGATGGFYFLWYGIVRFIMEPLRDVSDIMKSGGANLSQITSVLWILFGLFIIIWFQFLTKPFDKWMIKILPKSWMTFLNKHIQKEYEAITPIKPRRIFFFGEKVEYRKKYFIFIGPQVENRVKLWLPKEARAWTKREINRGKKFKTDPGKITNPTAKKNKQVADDKKPIEKEKTK